MKFFFSDGLSGEPSCPAIKNLSRAGMVNGLDLRVPVKLSPPGAKLQINTDELFPSLEARSCKNHGLVGFFPFIGEFRQSSVFTSTETSSRSANSAPHSITG